MKNNKKFMQDTNAPEEYMITVHMQNMFNTFGEEKVKDFIKFVILNDYDDFWRDVDSTAKNS